MIEEINRDREAIVQYLRRRLIGPYQDEPEDLEEPAYKHYTAGTLYPPTDFSKAIEKDGEEEDTLGVAGSLNEKSSGEDLGDDPIVLANQNLPSSMGISFYLQDDRRLEVEVAAAWYEKIGDSKPRIHRRTPLRLGGSSQPYIIEPNRDNVYEGYIFEKRARLHAVWRPIKSGWLVTVSLINNRQANNGEFSGEDCLHQAEVTCRPVKGGVIPAYPGNRLLSDDLEEHTLDLLYRHRVTYATGHGCSVKWSSGNGHGASSVSSEFLPRWEVFPISYRLEQDFSRILSQYFLSEGENHSDELIQELDRFVAAYREWVDGQPEQNLDIPQGLETARDQLMQRMRDAVSRMERGVRLLEQDPSVLRAFCLANRAMFLQSIHSGEQYAGTRFKLGANPYQKPDLMEYRDKKLWRPFQLAFQLLTISSVAYPEDPDRNLVDLIWFPTGGGKTEAYLAMTAFLIFHRRIIHGDAGNGTAVIMRYTLRLLTTQQFQRASTLLCACELIRRECPDELGQEAISIGLWVGESSTPNTFNKAADKLDEIKSSDKPLSPFQVDRCPWCGTEIVPKKKSRDESYGINATPIAFSLYCPSKSCPFHEKLPIGVIDDQLYKEPPTLLLATVDKFARLTWVEKGQAFFGGGVSRPPELIIQDELHLISGPLGTIVGLYESAIDALASWQSVPPKILASTATIRRADEQCQGLYARRVNLFPPSGLEHSNSYFARQDDSLPGRLYVGFMGQGHTGSTSMIRVSAALLQAPVELKLSKDGMDAYWTLVAYHNSLRELGKTLTFARDDIPARIKVIASDQSKLRALSDDSVQELTSNVSGSRLNNMLERLKKKFDEPENISFLACSNMFSVGVDIQRLGLMLVNGQPKSTSEYIQSTSRVGRRDPGLVVTLLSPSKPRDRSHYERFAAYHSALYRQVEPTSVTPFAPPARDRALHAVLVTLVRHALGYSANEDAKSLREDMPELDRVVDYIVNRVKQIDPEESDATKKQMDDLIREWLARIDESDDTLVYNSGETAKDSLLIDHSRRSKAGWKTLHSMRNVDRSSVIKIVERNS